MNWAAGIAGGLIGTVVLTTGLRGASELGLTRMDVPFLLGTAFCRSRTRAKTVGYALHFAAGLAFSLVYLAMFQAIGRSGWMLGALFGLAHAMFAGTVLVNIVLPAIHPRMGTTFSAADSAPLVEPPGFFMHNYGRATPVVTVILHMV
ncbi:MAG TPA: hypothetical protein VND92_04495, partial [Vicinamibacterales bacterium]|nr:hypothetical protein [Vicinamibacterales bacterium]